MKQLILLPLLFLALSSTSIASEEPIDEMFKTMSIETQLTGGFEAMLPMIDQMSADLSLNAEAQEELKAIFRSWFNEDIDRPKIIAEMKKLYQQTFSDAEIIQITEFYKTPVGRKLIEKSPELMKVGAQLGMQEAQSKQVNLQERIKPFLEKHEVK